MNKQKRTRKIQFLITKLLYYYYYIIKEIRYIITIK